MRCRNAGIAPDGTRVDKPTITNGDAHVEENKPETASETRVDESESTASKSDPSLASPDTAMDQTANGIANIKVADESSVPEEKAKTNGDTGVNAINMRKTEADEKMASDGASGEAEAIAHNK
jgi:hypothetical protein